MSPHRPCHETTVHLRCEAGCRQQTRRWEGQADGDARLQTKRCSEPIVRRVTVSDNASKHSQTHSQTPRRPRRSRHPKPVFGHTTHRRQYRAHLRNQPAPALVLAQPIHPIHTRPVGARQSRIESGRGWWGRRDAGTRRLVEETEAHVVVGLLLLLLLLLLGGGGVATGGGGSATSGRGGTASGDRRELGRALSDELGLASLSKIWCAGRDGGAARLSLQRAAPTLQSSARCQPCPPPSPSLGLTSLTSLPSSSAMTLSSLASSASMPTAARTALTSLAEGEALPPCWRRR